MQNLTNDELLKYWDNNKENYITETWWWTQDFVNKVFENFFWLRLVSRFTQTKDLFGNDLLDNIYQFEWKKQLGNKARRDNMLKINSKKVVVEVEAHGWIEKWMKQIWWYMEAENTEYSIVTDWWEWRFFKKGFDWWFETRYLDKLLSEDWKAFLETYYNTHDYYVNRLKNLDTQPFDTSKFHEWLITTAESLLNDFRASWLFWWENIEQRKQEIQTSYSLIIQFLLLKIIQNKRNVELISVKEIIWLLENKERTELFQTILSQIERLWEFYQSYHNQQESLISKILSHYKGKFWVQNFNLDTVRPFLDIYQLIFSFNFIKMYDKTFSGLFMKTIWKNYTQKMIQKNDRYLRHLKL